MMNNKIHWKISYIGLGSNQDNPIKQIKNALVNMGKIERTHIIKTSSFYETEPLGPDQQPNFINAAVALLTLLDPYELLIKLQHIEKKQKRERGSIRWGPRTIDLDILFYSNVTTNDDRLVLPHPEIQNRDFVLFPLSEIAPELMVSEHLNVVDLLEMEKPQNLSVKKIKNDD